MSLSSLTLLDKESTYYPKACNIPKILGKVTTLNYFKHKPNKPFALKTSMKGTYPVHPFDYDSGTERDDTSIPLYKNHYFNHVDLHCMQRFCNSD